MAVVNTIAKIYTSLGNATWGGGPALTAAGGGNSGANSQVIGVVVNATTTTVTFNTFPGSGVFRQGLIRVKTTAVNGATTITWKATLTDGTTTVQIVPPTATTAAGTFVDNVFPFITDLNANSLTVSLTSGTNTATYDVEVACGP